MDAKSKLIHPQYEEFLIKLEYYRKKGWIKVLSRGVSKKFGFRRLKLDIKYNTIEQFAERLFYFGEKSKYFWDQRIGREIDINDISENIFRYIFELFNYISLKENVNIGTANYRKQNSSLFNYFTDPYNVTDFINSIMLLNPDSRKQTRNYYFRIIHQLGESKFKKTSLMLSGSQKVSIAKKFSSGEIIINFWDFDFNNFPLNNNNIPIFIGKPYRDQCEISVFTSIFPHYIFSFKYSDQIYINPALIKSQNFDISILNGFDIDQPEFIHRLRDETNYDKGVVKIENKYRIISE